MDDCPCGRGRRSRRGQQRPYLVNDADKFGTWLRRADGEHAEARIVSQTDQHAFVDLTDFRDRTRARLDIRQGFADGCLKLLGGGLRWASSALFSFSRGVGRSRLDYVRLGIDLSIGGRGCRTWWQQRRQACLRAGCIGASRVVRFASASNQPLVFVRLWRIFSGWWIGIGSGLAFAHPPDFLRSLRRKLPVARIERVTPEVRPVEFAFAKFSDTMRIRVD